MAPRPPAIVPLVSMVLEFQADLQLSLIDLLPMSLIDLLPSKPPFLAVLPPAKPPDLDLAKNLG